MTPANLEHAKPMLLLAPSMDKLSNPFGDLEQIMARPFAIAELFAGMLACMANITDQELFAEKRDKP